MKYIPIMKRKTNPILWTLLLLLVSTAFTGCQEDEVDLRGQARLFMPYELKASPNRNGLIVRWQRSPGAKFYEVDIALNSAFDPIAHTETVVADSLTARFRGLDEQTTYYVRLRGLAADPTLHSKYVYAEGVTGLMYSIFRQPSYEEMSYEYATLRWNTEMEDDQGGDPQPVVADRLVISSSGANDRVEVLSPEVVARGSLHLENLYEGVMYRATMMNGDDPVSYTLFTTPSRPEGAIFVDSGEALIAAVADAPENATVVLEPGRIYDCSTRDIELKREITLLGGPGGKTPVIYAKRFLINGTTNNATIRIGDIVFSHLEISGMKLKNGEEDWGELPNDQAIEFNFYSSGSGTKCKLHVDRISLTDCTVRNYTASAIRMSQWSMHADSRLRIGEIYVSNSLFFDLGRGHSSGLQAFVHLNSNSSGNNVFCAKYTLRHSTFYHLYTGLIEQRKGLYADGGSPVVSLANCTFDKFAVKYPDAAYATNTSSRNFFCFTGFSAAATITDSVFGLMKVDDSSLLKKAAFSGISGTFLNTYKSTDGQFTDFTGATNAGTAAEIFPRRDEFDYAISADLPLSGVGDSRWYE